MSLSGISPNINPKKKEGAMKKVLRSFCAYVQKSALAKNLLAVFAVMGSLFTASQAMAIQSLEIVSKNATSGNVEFHPETLAEPIIDAIIAAVKYGSVIVLVVLGVYLIYRFFKGAK